MNLTRRATWGWAVAAVLTSFSAIDDATTGKYLFAAIGAVLALVFAFQAGRAAMLPTVILTNGGLERADG
jgi:hypothetical protein